MFNFDLALYLTPELVALLGFLGIFVLFLLGYMALRSALAGEPTRAEKRLFSGTAQTPTGSRRAGGGRGPSGGAGAGSSVFQSGTVSGSSIYSSSGTVVGRVGEKKSKKEGRGPMLRPGLIFGGLTEALAAQIPQFRTEAEALEIELRRAGYYSPNARVEYLAVRNLAVFGILLLTGIGAVAWGPDHGKWAMLTLGGGLLLGVAVYSAPRFVLRSWGSQRVREIQFGLPDALDMIAMSVSGGLSLHDSLHAVSREIAFSHPSLSFELDLVRQQTEMGALETALKHFSRRIDAPEVRQMAALVSQSERLGTNVVRALQDHADNIRHMQRAQADERASKTGVKMLFPLIFCLAPAVFIMLWGPAMLEARSFLDKQRREGGALSQSQAQILNATDIERNLIRNRNRPPAE